MDHHRRALQRSTLTIAVAVACLHACSTSSESSQSTTAPQVLASDPFTQGLAAWQVEQEDSSGTVTAQNGVLDVVQPAGATLWFKQRLTGNYEVRFTATPIPFTTGVFTDRISDLNLFWNASVPGAANADPTTKGLDGKLASYTSLALYYVGFGANNNTTTRLRRYDGTDARPQLAGYAAPGVATSEDKSGPMTAATSLVANVATKVRVVSRAPTPDDPLTLKWYANDVLVFSYADSAPYGSGWFALRTTSSHFQFRDFSVVSL